MEIILNDGEAYIQGRSPEKSQELLEKAEKAGIDPALVSTTSDGYIVPKALGGKTGKDGRLEIGMGVPEEETATVVENSEAGDVDGFDPANHTVAEVREYLDAADETERERVLAAEAEGKGRKGLLDEEGK